MARMKESPPWVIKYREINALFAEDQNVCVIYDDREAGKPIVKLYIANGKKADAISALLPDKYEFGNVKLAVEVIPGNVEPCEESIAETAFNGNNAVSFIVNTTLFASPITYVVFHKKVVQYFTDDLGKYDGIHSTLYEELARSVLTEAHGIYFSTDTEDGVVIGGKDTKWP